MQSFISVALPKNVSTDSINWKVTLKTSSKKEVPYHGVIIKKLEADYSGVESVQISRDKVLKPYQTLYLTLHPKKPSLHFVPHALKNTT